MFPGMNPKMMKQAMKRMGIQQQELSDVEEVIIRCSGKDIVIKPAHVSKVSAMGNTSWHVEGQETEQKRDTIPTISDEDIQTVMEQSGVDIDTAKKAIISADGDLAVAILALEEIKKEE